MLGLMQRRTSSRQRRKMPGPNIGNQQLTGLGDIVVRTQLGSLVHNIDTVHLNEGLKLSARESSQLVITEQSVKNLGNRPRDGRSNVAKAVNQRSCALSNGKLTWADTNGLRHDLTDDEHSRDRNDNSNVRWYNLV